MSGNQMAGVEDVQRQINDDVLSDAREAGVDTGDVISSVLEEKGGRYSEKVIARLSESKIRSRVEAAETEAHTGIVMGSRDRAGKNWPRRFSLVRSDGDHLEVSAWSGRLDSTEGGEARIPVDGGLAEIRAEYDGEYDSWEAKALGSVKELPGGELRSRLSSVAESPDALGPRDEYDTVVVGGNISYISPQTVFEDGEPQGPGSVLMEDERGDLRPHVEITLATVGDTVVRAHFERQRYGEPYFGLQDSDPLFEDAAAMGSPEEQCSLLRDAYIGERVVVVGNVSSYDRHTNDDGETKFYADIQASAIIGVPEGGEEPSEDTADSEGDSKAAESAESGASEVESIRSDIEQYCELTGESMDTLTADEVREKISTVPDDAPDSVINQALGADAGSVGAESDESPEPQESDDPLERLENPDGTYSCPGAGGDCLWSGSEASLYGHAMAEHIHDDQDPKEWVIENA